MKRLSRIIVVPALVAVCLALTGAVRSEAAASGITLAQACAADGSAALYFGWQGVNPAAKELWLDVISYGDGYRPAAVVSAGPLSPDTRAYANWSGFGAGGTYFIRLNQLMWDGTWDPSGAVSFTTFRCNVAVAAPSGASTATTGGAALKSNVSATGYASSTEGIAYATGNGPAPGSLSATAYTSANGGSSSVNEAPVIRPVPLPTNTVTYYMVPPVVAVTTVAAPTTEATSTTKNPGPALQ